VLAGSGRETAATATVQKNKVICMPALAMGFAIRKIDNVHHLCGW